MMVAAHDRGTPDAMPSYRFYVLNPAGKIGRAELADCADDAKAMATAQGLLAQRKFRAAVEVWHDDRFIGNATREEFEQGGAAFFGQSAEPSEAPVRAMTKAVEIALQVARRAAVAITGRR
jgi:hypothetical protein